MGRKERPQYLRLVNSRMFYLSSGCAEQIGTRADVYEYGNIMALVGDPMGQYHLSLKSEACRGVNLCAMELIGYIKAKYEVQEGERLTAWVPPGDAMARTVFFAAHVTEAEKRAWFDRRFRRLELGYQKRYGDWVYVEDNCVSFSAGLRAALPKRLSLYQRDDVLALWGEVNGPFQLQYRSSRKSEAIYSALLAEYCRRTFGGGGRSVLFHARPIPGGVYLSAEESLLPGDSGLSGFIKCDLGAPRDKFFCFAPKSIYFSVHAAHLIGERFSLYRSGDCLAFGSEPDGEFALRHTGYQNSVYSKRLEQEISRYYPGEKKLFLREHGELLVLTGEPGTDALLPSPGAFQKYHVGPQKREETAAYKKYGKPHGEVLSTP